MKYGNLIIAKSEYDFIKELFAKVSSKDSAHEKGYAKLRSELETAIVKNDEEVPDDVVRLKSMVDVQTPVSLIKGYQLVVPEESNPQEKKISILTPMGSAIIGYAASDEVSWSFPSGEQNIIIKNVYQPVEE